MTPYLLGLTGSIGMGKSTTASFFAAEGIPVWDADAATHRAYAPNGAAVAPIAALFPQAVSDRGVSRDILRDRIAADPAALARIEAVVHPLVAADRASFIAKFSGTAAADLILLDIPLLFETKAEAALDATLLVTAPPALQRARVLARPGMTERRFQTLLARQMPDAEKRGRACHILETLDLPSARAYVQALIAHIRRKTRGHDA